MTRRQWLMLWGLRAAVLWGGVELALAGYDEALRERGVMAEVRGHAAAVARLERRAREVERLIPPARAELAAQRAAAAILDTPNGVDPVAVLTATLRQDLTAMGAQQAEVAADIRPIRGDLQYATLRLRWMEPPGTSPAILSGLAAKRPFFTVSRIALQRPGGGMVSGEADLGLTFRVNRKGVRK